MKNRVVQQTVPGLAFALVMMLGGVTAQASSLDACITETDGGRFDQAIAACTDAIENDNLSDDDLSVAYFKRGLALKNLEEYEDAINDYSEAIELDPGWFEPWVNRGNAYTWVGEYERGIEDYNEALRLKPGEYLIIENRGQAYANLGQHDRALDDYNEAIRIQPDDEFAYLDRGVTYLALGRYDEALQDFNKAIELSPKYVLAYHNRSIVLQFLKRTDEARQDVDRVIEYSGETAQNLFSRGMILYSGGQFADAAADFARAIAQQPTHPYFGLWYFLSVANDRGIAAAKQDLEHLMDSDRISGWPEPIYEYLAGDTSAGSVLNDAANDAEICEAQFYIGGVELLQGQQDSAVARLQAAARDCPPDFVEKLGARWELSRIGAPAE